MREVYARATTRRSAARLKYGLQESPLPALRQTETLSTNSAGISVAQLRSLFSERPSFSQRAIFLDANEPQKTLVSIDSANTHNLHCPQKLIAATIPANRICSFDRAHDHSSFTVPLTLSSKRREWLIFTLCYRAHPPKLGFVSHLKMSEVETSSALRISQEPSAGVQELRSTPQASPKQVKSSSPLISVSFVHR